MISTAFLVLKAVRWRQLAVQIRQCPACARTSLMLRLAKNEIWVRCTRCRASSVAMSLVSVLRHQCPEQLQGEVYEMSARGALFNFLKANSPSLVGSEFVEGAEPGSMRDGIRCEDVQALSFDSERFDLVTSTEVFEHVPDDRAGFREVLRVLKKGGCFVFTVPLCDVAETRQRARLDYAGQPEFLLPPEYHSDPARRAQPVLTFREYGADIKEILEEAGFVRVSLVEPFTAMPWGYRRRVIVAWKCGEPEAGGAAI